MVSFILCRDQGLGFPSARMVAMPGLFSCLATNPLLFYYSRDSFGPSVLVNTGT